MKIPGVCVLFSCALLFAAQGILMGQTDPVCPGKTWQSVQSPEALGWSTVKLKEARSYSKTINTTAVMIIVNGEVLDQWGAVTTRINVHSIRKSFLSSLYGVAVEANKIDLGKTLATLGIDDRAPKLTATEKQATVLDLLKSKSGIYHGAAYETETMKETRPVRGSHAPGTFWFYNNWDFNALGAIYEKAAGVSVFDEFKKYIAEPIGMQDFRLSDTEYVRDSASDFPAYLFEMTARDMARFGLLYLRKGNWAGRQIVSDAWVRESLKPYSSAGRSGGFGYCWWVAVKGRHFPGVQLGEGSFSARGAGGHYIVVVPEYDLVIVHRVSTGPKRSGDVRGIRQIAEKDFGGTNQSSALKAELLLALFRQASNDFRSPSVSLALTASLASKTSARRARLLS